MKGNLRLLHRALHGKDLKIELTGQLLPERALSVLCCFNVFWITF